MVSLVVVIFAWSMGFAAEPIKIGVLLPFTGPLAKLGEEQFEGMEVAREMINGKGGINGRLVEYIKGDAPAAPAAISETERLITREKMNVIIGTYASSLALVASEVAERHQKVYLEVSGIANNLTERGLKYFFRYTGKANSYGDGAAILCSELIAPRLGVSPKALKVAIINEDSVGYTLSANAAAKKAEQLGLNVVVRESYAEKTLDLSPLVLKLKDRGVDVVLQSGYLNDSILFWRQAKELDFSPKAMIGVASGHGTEDFYKAFGKDAEAVMLADENPALNESGLVPSMRPVKADFVSRYEKKYNKTPFIPGTAGFDGAWLLFQHVIPKVPSLDPEEVRKTLLSLDLPLGSTLFGFGVKFAPPGDPDAGQNLRTLVHGNQWIDGKLRVVWPKEFSTRDAIVPLPTWKQRK